MSNVSVSPLRRFLLEDEAQPLFSRRSGVELFHAGPTSPSRASVLALSEIEVHPQFSRQCAVALVHAGPRSPHRRSRPDVEAHPHYLRLTLSPIEHPEVVVVQLDMEQNHSSSTYAPEFCCC